MRRLVEIVEWLFRHLITYPFLQLLFRNKYSENNIDLQTTKKILILRFDRIGDMIVTTPIFRALKQRNPFVQIGVFTSPSNAEIIRNNPNVDDIYILHRHWWALSREILRARKAQYDVVLNFIFNRTSSAGILANLVAPRGFKIGQGPEKYRFYFNRLLRLERSELHMAEVLADYVEQAFGLAIQREEIQFELIVDERSQLRVDLFLRRHQLQRTGLSGGTGEQYIVFNISATAAAQKISKEQILGLTRHLVSTMSCPVVLIGAPSESYALEATVREVDSDSCHRFPESGAASLLEIASLVKGARCVLSPDTSVIHFASALQTPVLGFFAPSQMAHEWVPYKVHHAAVYAPSGMPASAIPIQEMTAQVDRFIATLSRREVAATR